MQADAFELVRDSNHIVVFTQFRDVMECIARRMEGDGLMAYQLHGDVKANDRQDVVAEWSAGPPAALCCMLQIATGMNMTTASA